jgi:hypothetical protein
MPRHRTLLRFQNLAKIATLSLAISFGAELPSQAAPQYINGLAIPGNLVDLSGGTSVNNGRFGTFSDLYYDPSQKQWWGLSDRGPGGGSLSYDTRMQRFSLDIDKTTGAISNFKIEETLLFRKGGLNLNGMTPAVGSNLGLAFDPEGLVVLPRTGNFLISDEYGPSVYEFARDGAFIRAFAVPANALPKAGAAVDYNATPAPGSLTSGREGNRGLEGLAVSPDGRFAYAMLQNGTIADGTTSSTFQRSMFTRILKYDTTTGNVVAQYAYRLDGAGPAPSQGRGISAIVALDDTRFMIIERNNRGMGVNSDLNNPDKKVYIIDIAGATDVSAINFNGSTLPSGVVPVSKSASPLLNLAANTLSELAGRSPEKWEGLSVGPQLNDGSFLLLAGTDNDYSATQNGSSTQYDVYLDPATGQRVQCDLDSPTNCSLVTASGGLGSLIGNLPSGYTLIPGVLHAYRVSAQDLGGYKAPSQPAPGPLPLMGIGAALGWSRRLRQRRMERLD